ncbi:DNA helicase [Xenorhabdus cabanillasii JM26]|nr:DNA helicase [Xenorhabdus cabanillasii JM26]
MAITAIDINFGHTSSLKSRKHITATNHLIHDRLEWEFVELNNDFPDLFDPKLTDLCRRDEINLLYVAVTRARKKLMINDIIISVISNREKPSEENLVNQNVSDKEMVKSQ